MDHIVTSPIHSFLFFFLLWWIGIAIFGGGRVFGRFGVRRGVELSVLFGAELAA
jgi:hypothetical protein